MARATLTQAGELFVGKGRRAALYNSKIGVPLSPAVLFNLGAPAALSANGVANAVAVAGAGFITMNGALVASGVATLGGNCGRAPSVVSSNAGDTTQVVTLRGRDYANERVLAQVTLNGTTTVPVIKAMKYIDSVHVSAAMTGNLSVGTTDRLGLPFRIDGRWNLRVWMDSTDETATATITVADTATPSASTGDVRGTVVPATATNGTRNYRVHILYVEPVDVQENVYGRSQYYV